MCECLDESHGDPLFCLKARAKPARVLWPIKNPSRLLKAHKRNKG